MRPPAKQPLDKPTLLYGLALAGAGAAYLAWALSRPASGGDSFLFGFLGFFYLTTGLSALGMSLDSPPTGAARYALYFGVILAPPLGAYCLSHTALEPRRIMGGWLALGVIETGILYPLLNPLWLGFLKFMRSPAPAGPLPQLRHETKSAPRETPSTPPDPGQEQLVSTGSFKVDRAKALEKLQKFQLEDPDAFLLPWIRCAVVSGAKRIQIVRIPDGIEMRFNGSPFSREELAEPYEGLFSGEGEAGERSRHFAVGLLGALRTGPAQIAVFSGRGREAGELLINDPDSPLPDPGPPPTRTNILRVRWSGFFSMKGPAQATGILARAKDGFGPCDAELFIEGFLIPPLPPDNGKTILHLGKGKRRGCVMAGWEEGARAGRVRLYKQGALAAEIPLPALVGGARLSDDELTLNISQSGVVKNLRLEQDLEMVLDAARRLPEPTEAVSRAMRPEDWTGAALFAAGVGLAWLLIF